FFSSRRRHTRFSRDWSSDVCSSDLKSILVSYILNIETSTRNCSVSIANSGQTVALREIATEGFSHAEKLHVFVNEVMAEAGISRSEERRVGKEWRSRWEP